MAHPDALPYPAPRIAQTPPKHRPPSVPPVNLWTINGAWIGAFWGAFELLALDQSVIDLDVN